MIDSRLYNIAWEATQRLCGNLDFSSALTDFFRYLQQNIPIHHLILGKFLERPPGLRIISLTDASGTDKYDIWLPFTPEQHVVARTMNFFNATHSQLHFIPDQKHPLAKLYDLPLPLHPAFDSLPVFPMLCYRIMDNKRLYGGPAFVFQPDADITPDMLTILELLEAPFTVFTNASFQYEELRKIRDSISRENRTLRRRLAGLTDVPLVGANGGLKKLMEQVRQIAPLDISVLIRGETGSGKELVARAIHRLSDRASGSFVAVNCGAIPPELIDSELFGHVKGAFTGALSERKGKFEQADGGTLFLDEVAELPLGVQARLLRVLQERTVDKVGGGAPVPVNFRLIAATHRPLEKMLEQGMLREDLYYRLCVVSLTVPPLRERRQDIPVLVEYFLEQAANRFGVGVPAVPDEEMARLIRGPWPGNVRQLQNVVEEALALHHNGELRFPAGAAAPSRLETEKEVSREVSVDQGSLMDFHTMAKEYLERMLARCNGKISGQGGVAELTGLHCSTLKGKLDKYGIPYGRNTKHGA